MKIAIVSFEFEGLTTNGGLGTAYRRMAEHLAAAEHRVTVLFAPMQKPKAPRFDKWLDKRIKLVIPPNHPTQVRNDWGGARRSLEVFHCLRDDDFDVVHFPDNGGLAYFSLMAKKAGIAFQRTIFVMGTHGPSSWVSHGDRSYLLGTVLADAYDRASAEMADIVVSPSAYMVRFLKQEGWKLPKRTYVIPNINNLSDKKNRPQPAAGAAADAEIIFFGRLDPRKGVFLFADALTRMLERCPQFTRKRPLSVTFLGSEPRVYLGYQKSMQEIIGTRLAQLKGRIRISFQTDFSSEQSLRFIRERQERTGALVCIPSLVDNSPYVIVESIEHGLNFLTTDSGGQIELIHPADRRRTLCAPDVDALTDALIQRLTNPPHSARPSRLAVGANEAWNRFHESLDREVRRTGAARPAAHLPKVSLVMNTAQSAIKQTYPNVEICENAIEATGKYILFLDGAEFAARDSLELMVKAAESAREKNITFAQGIVELRNRRRIEWATPSVADPLQCLLALPYSAKHLLWNRRRLKDLSAKLRTDLSSDLSLWQAVAVAQVAEEKSVLVPVPVLRRVWTQPAAQYERSSAQVGILENFMRLGAREQRRLLRAVIGMHNEVHSLRVRAMKAELQLALSEL